MASCHGLQSNCSPFKDEYSKPLCDEFKCPVHEIVNIVWFQYAACTHVLQYGMAASVRWCTCTLVVMSLSAADTVGPDKAAYCLFALLSR